MHPLPPVGDRLMHMAPATVNVQLELDADPIAGEVIAAGVQPRAFSGWIELFASLEATLEALKGAASTVREKA